MKYPYGDLPKRLQKKIDQIKRVNPSPALSESMALLPRNFWLPVPEMEAVDLIESHCAIVVAIKLGSLPVESLPGVRSLLLGRGLARDNEGYFDISEEDEMEFARLACEFREAEGGRILHQAAEVANWPRPGVDRFDPKE